jgi:hypothetical protein
MTFTLETKPGTTGPLTRWTCDACGEKAPLWHRDPAKLDRSAKAHRCPARGPQAAPAGPVTHPTEDELFGGVVTR